MLPFKTIVKRLHLRTRQFKGKLFPITLARFENISKQFDFYVTFILTYFRLQRELYEYGAGALLVNIYQVLLLNSWMLSV